MLILSITSTNRRNNNMLQQAAVVARRLTVDCGRLVLGAVTWGFDYNIL